MYDRLVRRYVRGLTGRLDRIEAEVRNQSAAIRSHSAAIVDFGVELRKRLDELHGHLAATDEQMRTVIGAQWDQQAIARRIASLEERLEQNGDQAPTRGHEQLGGSG